MIHVVTCQKCHGRPLERLEERAADGSWHHNTDPAVAALADAWIASDPLAPLRWVPAPCPRCDGAGEYVVEFTPCKIF